MRMVIAVFTLCCFESLIAQWQRVKIKNISLEPVLFTIDDEGITPRLYHTILPNAQTYLFPRIPTKERPLIIRTSSMTLRQELNLHLEGGPSYNDMLSHQCRSYGDLVLKRINYEVGRIAAPKDIHTIELLYTRDGDITFSEQMKAGEQRKFTCRRQRCSTASVCKRSHCPTTPRVYKKCSSCRTLQEKQGQAFCPAGR